MNTVILQYGEKNLSRPNNPKKQLLSVISQFDLPTLHDGIPGLLVPRNGRLELGLLRSGDFVQFSSTGLEIHSVERDELRSLVELPECVCTQCRVSGEE